MAKQKIDIRQKLHMLRTIKNCAVFFVVLTIISLVLGFFIAVGAF